MAFAGQCDVVHITPATGQQPGILRPRHGLPDPEFAHGTLPLFYCFRATPT